MPLAASHPARPQLTTGARLDRVRWLELPARRSSVGAARSAAGEWLRGWHLPEEACEDAVLVLSELATNAIRHTASARFLCCVGVTADRRIHLEVHDHGAAGGSLIPRSPDLEDEGGRGLLLVELTAERWGVQQSALTGGNAVWARLAVRPCR